MNAFLDADTPVQILRRLMVGSEGTLGFIAEAVFDTVRDDAHHLTSLMLFPDMEAACSAVAPFVAAGAAAVELMDRASIAAVRGRPGVPGALGRPARRRPPACSWSSATSHAAQSELSQAAADCAAGRPDPARADDLHPRPPRCRGSTG